MGEGVSGENLFLDYSSRGGCAKHEEEASFQKRTNRSIPPPRGGAKRYGEKQFPVAKFTTQRSTHCLSRRKGVVKFGYADIRHVNVSIFAKRAKRL